ncbi:peptidase C13 [Dyella terrae]|uniref:Peptidase C13 n=2 Tax=Dyella TaxID=231454 RepID=A0A4R0YL68_9GAMM|nr:peptidase C13 [Dyella terrae]TCI06279.1 peptidase C13 [Dyella soli]
MLVWSAAATAAPDDEFTTRVTQAKLNEGSLTGPDYQKKLWAKIGNPTTDALKACIASIPNANKAPFTLVADVQKNGSLTRVEVRPTTDVATCLMGKFATWTVPPPPESPVPYPIEVDFTITP